MGPAPQSNLPSRPKFSWDAKSPPWTDGKGDQEEYRNSVKLWQTFHNALPDSNSNKIPPALQAICLKSQLYGRAKDLCSGISEVQLTGDHAVDLIVGKIYQKDALSVVSEAYRAFNQLWSTRRSNNETMKNFESRFSAQVAKFNSISATTRLPECITALMLLSNSAIDDSQRVSVMAAAAPSDESLNSQSSNDAFLSSITYQSVSSVIKQCDKTTHTTVDQAPLSASSAGTSRSHEQNRNNKGRSKGQSLSMKYPCDICGKYGHWKRNHNHDGSLPSHVKSFDAPHGSSASGSRSNGDSEDRKDKSKKKTISFNMATLTTPSDKDILTSYSVSTSSSIERGPLLDDGAPYSAIGQIQLNLLANQIGMSPDLTLGAIPQALNGHTHWQYGTGEHASPPRRILGSIVLTATSDTGNPVSITHLVVSGSSQWVIGRNVTSRSNIEHLETNSLVFLADGKRDRFSLTDEGFLSYISLDYFKPDITNCSPVSSLSAITLDIAPWSDIKKIIDKVHKHVCGHASFTYYKLLLERNGLWNDAVASYLKELVNGCTACRSTSVPHPSRKVSISSLSKNFNEVLCIDHLYLDESLVMHCMDLVSRYSSAHVVTSTNLKEAIIAFEASWVSQFWYPDSIRADKAFQVGEFKRYAEKLGIPIHPVPPGRLSKNAIESKHNIIRTVFLRLKEADADAFNPILGAYKAVSISNDLYGNDTMSAFELAKGFSCPIAAKPNDTIVPNDISDARDQLKARRKLALILRSKAVNETPLTVGDMVEVYQKRDSEKRGKWSSPKPLLSVNHSARSVNVPGRNGREITVAFEDTRAALPQQSFAQLVQDGLDTLDDLTMDNLDMTSTAIEELDNANPDDSDTAGLITDDSPSSPSQIKEPNDDDFSTENPNAEPSVGDKVSVLWPLDAKFYPGTVMSEAQDGSRHIQYDDGDTEQLDMTTEVWRFQDPLPASSSALSRALQVTSTEKTVLSSMRDHFGNKPFLRHQAQGFDQYPLLNAYKAEEETFLKTVRPVTHDKVPKGSNVISSHTLYKVKQNDDGSLKLKARIAPHGNEDDMKNILSKDCTTCPPTGLRILESIASLFSWKIHRADVKAAFLQTGEAQRNVYVRPPKESQMKSTHLWLLLTAAYGLVNANAKWQNQSDNVMLDIRLQQSSHVPQLFFEKENGRLVLIIAKIVDDLKIAGEDNCVQHFIEEFDKRFRFGDVKHGPGKLRFFGINTVQNSDFTIETDADDKLDSVTEYPFSRQRRKQFEQPLNQIEKSVFASTNSSLGWIGTAASPFCSFYASYMQQKAPELKVSHLIEQVNIVRQLKKLGTTIAYPRPSDNSRYELSVLVFADASRIDDCGQLGVVTGLLIGEMKNNSIYHAISWMSHKAKRPVKSVPAAEIFAAAEGIDEGKTIAKAYSELLDMEIKLRIAVDSKDLFTSLSTQRNSIDKSIRGDVSCIRFEFQTGAVDTISWIPGQANLADPLTKKDSCLTDALQLTLFTGRLRFNFEEIAETKSSEKNFG